MMKTNPIQRAAVFFSMLAMLAPSVYADDAGMEQQAEQSVFSGNEGRADDMIVAKFSDFAGDDTETLVDRLRSGNSLEYVIQVEEPVFDEEGNPVLVEVENEDGSISMVQQTELVDQTVTVENTAGALGYGGVVLALGLAEASLPEGAEYKDIVTALFDAETGDGILDMRAEKMGWGQIYAAHDLKVGEIMSAVHSARPERPERPIKPEKPEKPQKPDRPEKPEKPVKPEKPDKPGRPART